MGRSTRIAALVGAVALAAATGARAEQVPPRGFVADLYGEPDVRVEAGAVGLLLRSMLGDAVSQIGWQDLYARQVKLGPPPAGLLRVADREVAGFAADIDAAWIVLGSVERAGTGLRARVRLYNRAGELALELDERARFGDATGLARSIAARVGRAAGVAVRLYPAASIGQLRPYVLARDALLAGQPERAAAALRFAESAVAGRVPAAREIADTVSGLAALPTEARIYAALAAGRNDVARELARRPPDALSATAEVRALLAAGDVAAAERATRSSSTGDDGALALAMVAQARGQEARRDALLEPLLARGVAPAVAFAAELRPGELPAPLAASAAAALDDPGVDRRTASKLALRLAQGDAARLDDGAERAVWDTLRVDELDEAELASLPGAPPSPRVRGELALHRGDLDAATADLTEARRADPDDALAALDYGRVLVERGEYDRALEALVGVADEPEGAAAQIEALSLAGRTADVERALVAVPPDPASARSMSAHGQMAMARGDFQRGLAYLRSSAALAPGSAETQAALASSVEEAAAASAAGATASRGGADRGGADAATGSPAMPWSWGDLAPWLAIALAAPVLLWLATRVLAPRLTGTVRVTIRFDLEATADRFELHLRRTARPPSVGDLAAHARRLERTGHRQRRLDVIRAGKLTTFERVLPGTWFVHLIGSHVRGGQRVALGPDNVRQLRLARRGSASVAFDLRCDRLDIPVHVVDGNRPVAGASVSLKGTKGLPVVTDRDGRASLLAERGQQTVVIRSGAVAIERSLTVADRVRRAVQVDLAFERMVVAGVSLGGFPTGPGFAPASPPVRPAAGSSPGATAPRPSGIHIAHLMASLAGFEPVAAPGPLATASSPGPLTPAQGRYQLIEEIGRGSVGVVFRAHDASLARDVALKVIGTSAPPVAGVVERYLREAEVVERLSHPNLVAVYGHGSEGAVSYIAMELVGGRTLRALLDVNGALTAQTAAELARQLCDALDYAHGRSLVHRDIEPANVFVTPEGVAKLGNLGLARAWSPGRDARPAGPPLYVAPEVLQGGPPDAAADIYAVGCTLFEIVTGRPPFPDGDVLDQHLHATPPAPNALGAAISPALESIILCCLAKQPSERFTSARALGRALGAVASS